VRRIPLPKRTIARQAEKVLRQRTVIGLQRSGADERTKFVWTGSERCEQAVEALDVEIVQAVGAARHFQLPGEIASTQPQGLDRPDEQPAVHPRGGFRKDAQEGPRDRLVLGLGAGHPLDGDSAAVQHVPHQREIFHRVEIPGSRENRKNDVRRDHVVAPWRQRHVIPPIVDADVDVSPREDPVVDRVEHRCATQDGAR